MNGLLSTSYFPNIQYFSKFLIFDNIFIEIFEHFPKQTYRNRCNILNSNGIIPLVVPVLNGRSGKIKTRDIKISYKDKWQHQHLHSIISAYHSAPFFEYYFDEINAFLNNKYEFLIDLNSEILSFFLKILKINTQYQYTSDFININNKNFKDYRFSINPKNKIVDNEFIANNYIQVFSDRFDFISNLSILDLIFNNGPESKANLLKTLKLEM